MEFGLKGCLILLLLLACYQHTAEAITVINPTLLQDNGALCLSGIPAAYYFAPGSGDGVDNWMVFLPGGGWCESFEACVQYIPAHNINKTATPQQFDSILSDNREQNPDFFNWNKVMIEYCDGSSFTGDSENCYNGTKFYFRGARIYRSAMEELLQKGMGSAKNALLAGSSAGGVATMLHCDGFRDLFPSSTRVKCLSDAGYFFPAKKHNHGPENKFVSIFQGLISLHGSINMLPISCTSKLRPALCFFAQNVQEDIKTPIFFMMSEYDYVEIGFTTGSQSYNVCVAGKNCTSSQIQVMQDFRLELLDVLPKNSNCSSRGFLIYSNYGHHQITHPAWYHPTVGTNETMAKLFGDWYFDRKIVQVIDNCQHPYGCN